MPRPNIGAVIPICFFCEKPKNEVALLQTTSPDDLPMHAALDYEPCDECRDKWSKGIALIEARETPMADGQLPMKGNIKGQDTSVYPTGRWVVMRTEAARDLFQPHDIVDEVLDKGRALIDTDVFEFLTGDLQRKELQ
jgi:hypothetical protein